MAQRPNNALQTVSNSELAEGTTFTAQQVELIRTKLAPQASVDDLGLFLQVASARGLDPFRKHIYAVSRWNNEKKAYDTAYQVSIDGLRLIAERTGKYEGQVGPYWCGPDGIWHDIWLSNESPAAAKVGVLKRGFREPLFAVAKFSTYAQKTSKGELTKFWRDMPEVMIAKVAESAALRRAFPEEAGGLYMTEEMDQASNGRHAEAPDSADVIDIQGRRTEAGDPATELRGWAYGIGVDDGDLNRAASALAKVRTTIDDMPPGHVRTLMGKLQSAHGRDSQQFFAWLDSLNPDASQEAAAAPEPTPTPIRDDTKPIDTTPPTMDDIEAALAASTPVLPGVDVPEATTTDTARFTR